MKKILLILSLLIVTGLQAKVKTGVDVLQARHFDILKGKRVGLVTNPTGVNGELKSTIDLLAEAEDVNLVALFAPEHGVRGDVTAGGTVKTYTDKKTGVKVWSIYGTTLEPTAEMLKGVDVMVYDIQDIGCRSYTFISTMGRCMQACAKAGIEFVVLDRPNPLGGEKVEGCLVEKGCFSFVSQYSIPYVYGLTCGELARYLNEEGLLRGGVKANLTVVPMEGWKREMQWQDTDLYWVLTSPHIPQPISAIYYPASGILGELDYMNIGVGYNLPFQLFCAAWVDASELADKLNSKNIPGWLFRPIHIFPYYGFGARKNLQGVQPYITDYEKANLSLLQFYVMEALAELYPAHLPFSTTAANKLALVDKVCGSKSIRAAFKNGGFKVSAIYDLWMKPAEAFKEKSRKYRLY